MQQCRRKISAAEVAGRRNRRFLLTKLGTPAGSAGMSILWPLMAATHPATTYHVTPLLAVAAWPVLRRLRTRAQLPRVAAATSVGGGAVFALLAIGWLTALGALQGPTLLETPGAGMEAVIGVALGAGLGLFVARWRRPSHHAAQGGNW